MISIMTSLSRVYSRVISSAINGIPIHSSEHEMLTRSGFNVGPPLGSSQQARDTEPTLVSCWASVADDGPALIQRELNVLCLQHTLSSAF